MIFTLFLPKAPAETIKTLRAVFTVILGWLAHAEVTAHLGVTTPDEEADDERDN